MRTSMTEEQFEKLFWSRVNKTDACWLWIAAIDNYGYGRVRYAGRTLGAHRISYMLIKGKISKGLDLDHLCKVRHCVNPNHLEPVTDRQTLCAVY